MSLLTKTPEWQKLQRHYQAIKEKRMQGWFDENPKRFSEFSIRLEEILFDYSKNRVTTETINLLNELAVAAQLPARIRALFCAEPINTTESRPALHMALRHPRERAIYVNGEDALSLIHAALAQMRNLVDSIHQESRCGVTGKAFKYIVNIGIGGSHLGPMMATHALAPYAIKDLRFYFISGVDKAALQEVWQQVDPERTLFIVSSKSFTTIETLTNAHSCLAWLQGQLKQNNETLLKTHFVAVTAEKTRARKFGIREEDIFPIWDWVGGRYSVWSAIGLSLALQIGIEKFEEFLSGAHQADEHFRTAAFLQNIPVIMGLLSVWYINFFETTTHAIIPYDYALKHLCSYLQQLDMESNGKRITHAGIEASYTTGAIVWGELGLHGQHAFYQLFHQGTHLVPVDFILNARKSKPCSRQDFLIANALSQAHALMCGKSAEEFESELGEYSANEKSLIAKHKALPGNRPSNIFFIDEISPRNLGMLLAFYEHKVFVQSVIWNVNPFDQWGVELGKLILPSILEDIQQGIVKDSHDSSTQNLILYYRGIKKEAV